MDSVARPQGAFKKLVWCPQIRKNSGRKQGVRGKDQRKTGSLILLCRKVEGKEGRYELHATIRNNPTGLRKILFRGGIFRYLFRKPFLKSPILPQKRGV